MQNCSIFRMSPVRMFNSDDAVVAQLVRALVCGTRGRRFDSHQPYHSLQALLFLQSNWSFTAFCISSYLYRNNGKTLLLCVEFFWLVGNESSVQKARIRFWLRRAPLNEQWKWKCEGRFLICPEITSSTNNDISGISQFSTTAIHVSEKVRDNGLPPGEWKKVRIFE